MQDLCGTRQFTRQMGNPYDFKPAIEHLSRMVIQTSREGLLYVS